jgi:hypothetical protein
MPTLLPKAVTGYAILRFDNRYLPVVFQGQYSEASYGFSRPTWHSRFHGKATTVMELEYAPLAGGFEATFEFDRAFAQEHGMPRKIDVVVGNVQCHCRRLVFEFAEKV